MKKQKVEKTQTVKQSFEDTAGLHEELILEYRTKARKLGRSILRRWQARLDLEEVDSVVDLSLCEAVQRFDPSKGASFMTFLYYHLKGNLIRTVTAAAQANFVPGQEIETRKGDEPKTITALDVVEAISGTDQRNPDDLLLQKELIDLSKDACTRLDPLEREVIERLYLQGEQLMKIASSLGYSRCHISRVKKKALENLQDEMEQVLDSSEDTFAQVSLQNIRKIQRRKKRVRVAKDYGNAQYAA
ncbi:MAG: sigma-70 family RNA polymerase sigma factor [Bdellovibrionota bacterium]|jgi:RNA polymerase sigma factor (sigma-70 family)